MNYSLASSAWDELEYQAMQEVIFSGHFTMGPKVQEFEQAFAKHFGAKYGVMSNSGSSANLLAMAAMRYSSRFNPRKTDIIVPAVSWSTTYYPIHQLGFRLKFVDIDLETLNASADVIARAIDKNTAGIFAVNLLGNPSELDRIRALADHHGIFFLEDNCESMGAKLHGKYAGTFGDVGTFSTFFSHHISTMEGGMCLTDDEELAQIMVSMRAHGWTRELPTENLIHKKTGDQFFDSFNFVLPGYNLRPLELSGAIGIEQLKKLNQIVSVRQSNASLFLERMNPMSGITIQKASGDSSWFGFSILLTGEREGLRDHYLRALKSHGIETRPIVAGNFTKNPVIKLLSHSQLEDYPNADYVDRNGFFVGNHHFDLTSQIHSLGKVLKEL